MEKIYLEKINLTHKNEIEKIKKEYDNNAEDYNGAFFIKEYEDYAVLIHNLDNYSKGIMDNPNYVPYTCYVALNEDGQIVGVGSLRHELNDYLMKCGGHIGYSVVPSQRKKGYGSKILKLLVEEANKMEINKILVTCSKENLGSLGVIKNNNGILENEIEDNGRITCRFWIG